MGQRESSFLILLTVLFIIHQAHNTSISRRCSVCPKPLNKSIKSCWDNTRLVELNVEKKVPNIPGVCPIISEDLSTSDIGKEIMGTFRNIKCMMRKEPFADVENINSIEIAVLEIAMNPEVCVVDTHSLDDCSALDTLSDVDYSKLYTWIIKQIRLLESLYLITLQM